MPTSAAKRLRASRVVNDESHCKLREMVAARKLSRNTLLDILSSAREQPELLEATAASLQATDDSFFEDVRTDLVLSLERGRSFTWTVCDPSLLVGRVLAECPPLAKLYVERLAVHPCTKENPWSCVFLFDELTPGSISHPQHGRKMMNLAFNFLEIGDDGLQHESTWHIAAVLRATVIREVIGGWSRCFRDYLRLHFGELSMESIGVSFLFGGQVHTIFARLGCICSDGEGLMHAFDTKGHAAIRPCALRCANELKKNSNHAHRRPGFVEITCADHTRFRPISPQEVNVSVDELIGALEQVAVGTMTAATMKSMETAAGLSANPFGLLAAHDLRAKVRLPDVLCEDWMHGALQGGTMTVAMQCLFLAMETKTGFDLERLHRFLKADWSFPMHRRQKMRQLSRIFDEHSRSHMDDDMHFKCMASELLGLYSLVRHFVDVAVSAADRAVLSLECQAFAWACDVVDMIMLLKRSHASQPHRMSIIRRLREATDKMIATHIAAYGDARILPKHHRMQHIAEQIKRWKVVIDAFIIERLHLVLKDVLSNTHNPIALEASLLRGICNKQLRSARQFVVKGLQGVRRPLLGFAAAMSASALVYGGLHVHDGDMLRRSDDVGVVLTCLQEHDDFYFIVDPMVRVRLVCPHASAWRSDNGSVLWSASECEEVIAWYADGAETIVIEK